ncbi:MAG: PLxRFG domain-containing protein [Anaerolineae bacterium]|nr:PLxRFG domain-containing protein [Anaerolineae bacterium]
MGNWWDEQPKPTGSLASLQPTVQPPSVPAFDSEANNPYAAQLAQSLQAYRNRPSRFSTEPASLPAPAQPPEADKPAFDLGNSLSALYEGATEQFIPGVKSALAQAYTGLERPDRNPGWATRFMEEGRQAQQQADQRTAELQRQGQSDSTSEAIRSAIPSLGFSLGSMAAAIPAGLAGAAATQAAIPIPGSGLVGGALAAGAASGVAGYRMAGSQFLNDTFAQMEQESQKQRGRGLTEQEKATAYQELRPVAENTGLWEAGPEAIGNAAMLGLGRVALGLMPKAAMQNLAASALGRAGVRTGAAAGALATEVGTEGVTQFAQGNDQQKGQAAVDALLSGKDMKTAMAAVDPQYQGFQGLVQSTKDVAPATIATVLLMGGLAKPGHMAYSALQDRAETNRRGEQADEILANTQPFRAALDRADAADLSQVLSAFNQIREAGKIPKSAMERLDSAQSAVEAELTRKQAIESQVAADTGQQGAPVPSDFLGPVNADPLADQIAAEDRRAQQSADFNANPRSIGSLLNDWNQRESMRAGAVQGGIAADRARLSEIAQQQAERQRQETLADRTQAIQQKEADRRDRLNVEIATRGAQGELARLLGPETQAPPTPRQEAPAPQSLSDLLNRPSQSSAVPTARAGERGSLSDLFPQNRNWWDTELSPSATTETPAPPKSGWARFGNETGTLNIPRAEMPQVKAEHRGALVNFLNARGVAHEADTEVDPATLKPTQAEFSPQKVRKAINYQGGDRSILVSSDGYVLDGHHQWLAALEQGKPIKAIRLNAPIANLLPLTREFPSSTVSKASNVRGGQTGREAPPTTAAPTQPETPSNETRKAEAAPLLNREVAPPSNAAPTYTGKAPWEMALDEFAQSRIDASGYADAYREDPKAADAFKKGQQSKWIDALRARAEEGRISDVALDDFVGRYGMPALHREFRGVLEKGIEGYQPPEIRNSPIRKTPETAQNQPWEMTWEEYRKKATPDGVPDKAAKTPAYWKSLKNQHRNIIARALSRKESVPDRVFSDYPDLKPAKETSAAENQPTNKKPADLILWGYKPGTSDVPIKLGPFSKAEQSRREKDGWKTAAYAKGDEPTGLRDQAKNEAPKAPALPTPNRQRQQVVTASGRKIDTEFEAVELDDLITSDKAEFPKALQPRDRSRLSSVNQVMTIAGKLDPQQLADSRLASDGAPVIGPDNVVESGNGRAMALREVYGRERLKDRADAYRAMIEANGFDVAGMKQPVLVRRRITTMTDQERKAFTEEANARNTLGMSPAERAMVHAGRMDATLLDLYKGGDLTTLANSDFVRGFMSEVAPDEAAEIRTADGLLNQEGIRRIEAAILAKAYPDSALLGTLLESTDNNIKAIGGALLDSAPAMAGMKGKIAQGLILPETDISAEVVESARLVAKARREGKLLSELLAQSGMFGDNVSPLAQRIVRLFFADTDFKRQISRDKIAGLLNTYAELAKNIKPGDALFDDLPALTVGDVIGALEKKNREPEKQQQPALFGGNPARQSGTTGGRETQRPDDGAPGATAGAAEQGPSQADDLGAIFDQELEKAFANAPSTGESVERDREIDQTENGVGTEDVPTQRAGTGRRTRNASGTDEGGRAPEQGDSGVSNAPSAVPGAKRAGGISAKDGTVRPQRGATGSGDSGRGGQPSSERIRSSRGAASRSGRTSKAADAGVKAGQAAVEVGQGLKATMDGLAALFGGKGKLSSGLTFDEETYQQAVPFFKDAVRHFKDAAKDAREAIRLLIQAMMGGGYDKAVIASMKPYAIRFVTDVQNGVIDLTETEPHAEPETIEPARVDYTAKRDAQRAAESVAVKVGDIDNIRATLPYLLPEQQNDVLKAEQRFERNNGILFTNATGTGKTYTGLGVIKRMVKAGKENILIVVPSQTKAQDWVDDGKNLGLDITVLPDTQTAGKGQVITTYANLSENDALDRREWDAIVYDESHKLASNQAGKNTVYQDRHERLTMYSGAALQNRANSLLSEADRATRNRLLNKINAARGRSREEALTKDELGEWDRINEKIAKIAQDLSTKTKPKVVFLSATPFAYHQNLDYADKLLFDYEQDYTPTFGYNAPSARQAFFIRHFGYRMRTGKLTEPDVNVDVDLMERRFHEWLKKTGAVSGRKLTTDQDYSREFVEIENSVGKAIDRGIDIINGYHEDGRDGNQSKFPALSARLQANLDFLAKSRLLEAIKAESAAKRARQHIALGRKVVIFHDYIEGNNQHPFRFPNIHKDHVSQQILKREIDRFNREFPELVNLDLGRLSTVIDAFRREFGDQAKFFNGRETKKNRASAIAEFNRDDNATQILVVQRDAGKEGISLHDVTGKRARALIDLGLPTAPTEAIQTEGRIYRYGQKSNAVIEYLKSNTKFEEHMFARRVASRARTAENLALGDMARNMENAFVDAYLNSSNDAPSDKQGTGNTAADARIQNDVPFDTARSLYFGQRKRTSRDKSREGVDYFATPEPLGLKMVEWADASTGDAMLEPSAGHGAIARWFPEDTRNTFVEPSRELSVQLGLSARHGKILDHDFETLHVTNKYDAIVMNPPFGSGGATAIAHLGKAAGHLKNGGRIVVLYPEGPAADKRMSAFLEKTDNLYTVAEFGLPPVVFERAGTTAKTRVLVLEKQLNADDAPNGQGRIDLNADTIGEFFDKIRDLSVKPRNKPTKAAELEPATAPITPAARGTVNDLLARSDESWLTARGDGVRRVLSKDGIKAAIDHLVPELAQEDSAVAVAFVRMGRSSTGLIPSRETNRLLSLGMAVLNHLRKMNLTGKGFEAFDRYASISGALRDALDAKYRDSTAAPVTAPSDQDAVGFILNRTTHAKKSLEAGQPVPWFSVSMDRKISSAAYTALAAQAKKLGGYWSSYRGQGAIPGFQFSSEQAATDFIAAASTGNSYSMPSGRGGATPAQTRADLSRALGADVVARLEQSGRLVIHDKPPTGAAAGAQGWVDQKGVIHLVPANLESSALSVVLHESAHLMRDDRFSPENRALGRAAHAVLRISGLQGLIGNPSYNDLIQNVYRLAAEGNKTAQAALAKATVEPGNTAEEALSYIVEYADEKLPMYRRIMSAIRAALYRLGIKVNLTPADLRALALSALKSRAKEVTARNVQPAFSLPDFAPTEADRVEVERQMKAVKEARDNHGRLLAPNGKPSKLNERQWKQVRTQFFKDWFGDWQNDPDNASKVVDENGEPMVVYHGSPDARFMSSDATFKSQAERYGFGSPIGVHWFASSEQTAKTYADERRAFDYQNAEPGIVAAFLNIRDAIEINANGQKWREAQKVGKTSSVIDKAQTEGRDGVIIENVKDDYQTGAIKGSRATTTFSVFSSTQIKSAIGNAGTFSPRSNRIDYSQAADEAEQDQLWREFQAVRAQFQERQASQSAFERWFGQGVEGVNVHKGKPLTLFHGTNNPEFNRWDESLSGQASRHPTAGLGFFMTADARSAARYGSRLLELNAKINKPYFMTDADLTSIEDTKDAARFRRKLQAQGYDAAVIVAPRAAPYVVAFQSNQVKLTSNTNPTESEDFRYSRPGRPPNLNSPRVAARVMDDLGGVMNDLKPGEKPLAKANPRNFAQMLTDLKANTRPQWLGLLTRNMQLELAREVLPRPMVEQFENAAEAMDAAESKMIQREAFPLADRWQALMRKHREQADRLARSLYMATWTGTDPRQPMPTNQRAEWIRTKATYDGLTDPEAKKLFSEVLGFYQGQTKRLFKELQNRIDRHSLPAADKLAAKDMLRQEFERMKDDGPYVPLMRFGDLTVFAEGRKEGEKPVFATFETVQDQRAFADWLKKEGYQPQLGVKTEEVAKRALPQGDFVGKLAGIIDKTTQGPEGQVLKDAMYQLFLRSLPEQAIRKHFIHRRFVPGYTADALRTFATFGRRSAKQIARLAHSDRMSDALEAMAKANREGQTQEPVSAGHLINELEKSFQWAMNPGTNALSSRLTHLGFLWHLGASPAHLFLNLSQQAQVTFPWLAGEMHGKIGSGSVAAALAKANKDFIASNPFTSADKRGAAAKKRRSDLEGEFNGDMGRALKALEESGKTDKTQTYSLSGLSEEDSWLWSKPYLRKFTEGAAWFFHVAEVINREASAIAAYRLARRAGMSHEQGYDLARRAINETHFDYSPGNRARFMRGNVAKVLTLFKQYSLNISWQLGRNAYLMARGGSKAEKAQARTKLLGMLGMTMVMAGAAGMPFYGEIMWMLTQLLNATRDDDEPEWDADTEFRSLLDRAFGETGDEAVRHGLINAFMGIDVGSRIKLDDLWWRPIGDDADGKNMAYQMMEQALGPVAGLFVRGVATADGLMESLVAGDNARGASWRAIEGSLPKALKDISRSIRYAKEGATTFQGATLLPADRISALAKLGQAMGFVPAELAERYSENRAMKSLERRILTRRRALLDTVAMGLLNQDDEVVRAASEDIAAFNRRYPTVAITGNTISKSLRGRLRAKIETEAAGGARLDKRLAGMLLEGIR